MQRPKSNRARLDDLEGRFNNQWLDAAIHLAIVIWLIIHSFQIKKIADREPVQTIHVSSCYEVDAPEPIHPGEVNEMGGIWH